MQDKKDIVSNNTPEKQSQRDMSFTLFESDEKFSQLYKKTERITTAIFLITNLFTDMEPLKWKLRQKSSDLLPLVIDLRNVGVNSDSYNKDKVQNLIAEIVSLFEIAHMSGIVSDMNFSILKKEFLNFISMLTSYKDDFKKKSVLFDASFFDDNSQNHSDDKGQGDSYKGQVNTNRPAIGNNTQSFFPNKNISVAHFEVDNKNQKPKFEQKSTDKGTNQMNEKLKDLYDVKTPADLKKTNRRSLIINTIKKKGSASIKDITSVIKGYSEKTIQRELAVLVDKNVLKREGERRWSTYSLAI